MLVARHLEDHDVRVPLHQRFGLEVHPVDRVDLIGHQRVHPRRTVVDRDLFDRVEPAAVVLVVVLILGDERAHAGLEVLDLVAAGADAFGDALLDAARRVDDDVIVRQEVGEVGVAGGEHELHLVVAELLHLLDRAHDGLGGGLGALLGMDRQRLQHVVGVEVLAVMERHALAEVEGPGLGVGRRLPAFGELALERPVGRDLGQAVEHRAVRQHDHEAVGMRAPVPAVGGVGARDAHAQRAAVLRLGAQRHAAEAHERGGAPSLKHMASVKVEGHASSPCCILASGGGAPALWRHRLHFIGFKSTEPAPTRRRYGAGAGVRVRRLPQT